MGRRLLLPGLAALALGPGVAAAQHPGAFGYPVYRLSMDGGGLGYQIDQTVAFLQVAPEGPGGRMEYWAMEARTHEIRPGKPKTFRHQWIDGRQCPALGRVLASIGDLPEVRIGGPDNRDSTFAFDAPLIALSGPAPRGEAGRGVTVTISQSTGWLHDWWRSAGADLAPCWQDSPRAKGGGRDLPTVMFTDQDAKELKP